MRLSVVISTRNRAKGMQGVLDAFAGMEVPKDISWELLIVNNGSSDRTGRVLAMEKSRNRLPLRILSQPVPGKCRSVNAALAVVTGDPVILSDDDMTPCRAWLATYAKAARERPEVSGFTGRIHPVWEREPPQWMQTDGPYAVPEGVTNRRDYGELECLLSKEEIPGGGNTALRKSVFELLGGFREDMGPGTRIPFAEDTEFFTRYLRAGGRFCYLPGACMNHFNAAERLTKPYVAQWVRQAGYCQIVAFKALNSGAMIRGIPRYLLLQSMHRLMSWWLEPLRVRRFHKKLRFMHTLGEIQGYVERKRSKACGELLPAST